MTNYEEPVRKGNKDVSNNFFPCGKFPSSTWIFELSAFFFVFTPKEPLNSRVRESTPTTLSMSAPNGAAAGPPDDSAACSEGGAGAVRDDAAPPRVQIYGVEVTPSKLSAAVASCDRDPEGPLDPPPTKWTPVGHGIATHQQRKSEHRLVNPAHTRFASAFGLFLNANARCFNLHLDIRIAVVNSPALLGWT